MVSLVNAKIDYIFWNSKTQGPKFLSTYALGGFVAFSLLKINSFQDEQKYLTDGKRGAIMCPTTSYDKCI